MNTTTIRFVFVGLLVYMGLAIPAAQAQAPCTLQTFTGTYAFYEKGTSSMFDPNLQPFLYHWAGAFAPFVTVGKVTMGPDGIGEVSYWIREGSLNPGVNPISVQVRITEMNEDCTGKFTYKPFPGAPATIVERFILFDNGREYRAVPSSVEDGTPTMVWIHEGHRISKPGEPLNTCGPQTGMGTYLMTAENFLPIPDYPSPTLFENAVLLRLKVSMSGEFTGMLYEKLGPVDNIELPVWGTSTVNPDCTSSQTLNFDVHGAVRTIVSRGVYFNEGKDFYALGVDDQGLGLKFSFGQGKRIGR